jgi:hypothetical protein
MIITETQSRNAIIPTQQQSKNRFWGITGTVLLTLAAVAGSLAIFQATNALSLAGLTGLATQLGASGAVITVATCHRWRKEKRAIIAFTQLSSQEFEISAILRGTNSDALKSLWERRQEIENKQTRWLQEISALSPELGRHMSFFVRPICVPMTDLYPPSALNGQLGAIPAV